MVKRPTIADIASQAGVSTGAVSYALNGRPGVSTATRDKILAIAEEIGWRPSLAARSLTGARVNAVGLIIPRPARVLGMEPFFMQFISGVESVLSANRTALLLQVVPDHDAADEAVRFWWAERRIDGILVTDLWAQDQRPELLAQLGVPGVIIGRPRDGLDLPAVWSDDATAVESVVDYLVTIGHRRIARVAGLPSLEHTQIRTAAFRAAAERHGLESAPVISTDYTWEEGAQATRRLLTTADRPTAITYDNDLMAVAALSVAHELAISVPGQLSIVAGDDSQLCLVQHPSITALARDIVDYGARAAQAMLDLVEDGQTTSHQVPTAALVPRASTSAAPV
ncbi:LacI family DNA-binding transcriptional regulator [Kribbella sp. NPDC056951]|uniref:LacI family DNA-binding transcriptional regulator n=1 Tax=Kribbella sp. NPDC056951 TaxID=3345978 RepID=UPI00363864FC